MSRFCRLLTAAAILAVPALLVAQPMPPTIHRVNLLPADGTLVIEGTGLGAHLMVSVDGQTVITLPGATDSRMEVQAPVSVLTVPGTYRLTVVDPVRRSWDGFIVASAPVAMAGVPLAGVASNAGRDGADVRGAAAAGEPPGTSPPSSNGTRPLTVIEDSGSPFRTALGHLALSNTTGVNNTGVGYLALISNTIGSRNTGIGYRVLESNTTGNRNTAIGSSALNINTEHDNTATGYVALGNNTTGSRNTAIGASALDLSNGSDNTAIGYSTLSSFPVGNENTAVGGNALFETSGDRNTGVGALAGYRTTTGVDNIIIGARVFGTAADTNTIRIGKPFDGFSGQGQYATFIAGIRGTALPGTLDGVYIDAAGQLGSGPVVPANDTVGSAHVITDSLTASDLAPNAVGTSELANNAVTAAKVAFNYAGSTAEGGAASDLACAGCVAATEVSFAFAGLGANAFTGTQAIGGNLDLPASTATAGTLTKSGVRFLHDRGSQNTFLGATAGNFTLAGGDNTGTGMLALTALTTGARNTASGSQALVSAGAGSGNTGSGYRALFNTTSGTNNTAVGLDAGVGNTTGSENIYLGANVQGGAADANTTRIGQPYNATSGAGQNKVFVAGIAGTVLATPAVQVFVDANGQLGTLVPAPITGTIDGTVSPGAVDQRLAEQDKTIAELRARLARLEALLAARPGRR
jgi:hypothetical protein